MWCLSSLSVCCVTCVRCLIVRSTTRPTFVRQDVLPKLLHCVARRVTLARCWTVRSRGLPTVVTDREAMRHWWWWALLNWVWSLQSMSWPHCSELHHSLPHLTTMTKSLSTDLHVHVCIHVDIALYILSNGHVMPFARTSWFACVRRFARKHICRYLWQIIFLFSRWRRHEIEINPSLVYSNWSSRQNRQNASPKVLNLYGQTCTTLLVVYKNTIVEADVWSSY